MQAQALADPFIYDAYIERRKQEKIEKERESRITVSVICVNKHLGLVFLISFIVACWLLVYICYCQLTFNGRLWFKVKEKNRCSKHSYRWIWLKYDNMPQPHSDWNVYPIIWYKFNIWITNFLLFNMKINILDLTIERWHFVNWKRISNSGLIVWFWFSRKI